MVTHSEGRLLALLANIRFARKTLSMTNSSGQFHKHFTCVTYDRSKVGYTILASCHA
jgi:hypothetical protein